MSDENEDKKPVMRQRRLWPKLMLGLVVLLVAGGFYLMSLVGTQITAPDWVRQKITARINSDIEGLSVGFGEVAVVMQESGTPRLLLRDVRISDAQGAPLVTLSDVAGTVALGPLLRGKLQPATIRLSGARVNMRRSEEGAIDLSLEDSDAAAERAVSFAALVERLDQFLLRPQFAALDSIEADNLSVRFEDARAGRAWSVDGGRLGLTRVGDDLTIRGDFALLGDRAYATTLAMSYAGRIGSTAADLSLSFEDMATDDIAGQSAALTWLQALDAPISGALRASVDEAGALGPLSATLQIGEGVLQPTDATTPIAFTSARTYFTYDPITQSMQFSELSLNSDWVTARAEGTAYLAQIEHGLPRELLGQMKVTEISANPKGLYSEPITLEGATMDVRLQIDPFLLSLGQLSVADQGNRLVFKGALAAAPDGWRVALEGQMDALSPERLLELWPVSAADGTRKWIAENVRRANLKNIQVAIRSVPEHKPDFFLGFDFDGLTTRFVKDVPPITEATGHASLYDNRFVITAESGHVTAAQGGRIEIKGTSFIVPDVRIKRGPARTRLNTSSTITAALSLLDEKPFRFLQKAGKPVTLADGQARLKGQLDFLLKPKLQTNEVAFDVTGKLRDVRSDVLVPDRILRAAELDVSARTRSIRIGGKGLIGAVPVEGYWQSNIGPEANGVSQLTGKIELSERFADEFRIGLPPGSLSGTGWADIAIDFQRDAPGRFALSSDLAGVGLSLRQLDWALRTGSTGTLNVTGTLGTPPAIDGISLEAAGLSAQGSISLNLDGSLNQASFSNVKIGTWLEAPVDLVGRAPGSPPLVRVRGGMIDLRQTSLGGDGADTATTRERDGGPVSMVLDRLQISDGIALTDFRAELNLSRGVDGNFTGLVNGGTAVTGRVVPQGFRSAFRIQSDNAGGVMSSAGLLKQARDGKMDLILTPAGNRGSYNGQLGIDEFRIKDAPSLAALMNAISVVGLLQQFENDGLHFSRVDAKFHLGPERVTLLEGSAVGASLGISMDGFYHMASGQMDMQGVFSPIYLVNAIGEIFTRKGEGLIGFNYTIKGLASNPQVSVNPLSALTPGMFRDLFRRQPPKLQRGAAPQQDAPPAAGGEAEGRTPPRSNTNDR